VQAQVIVYSRPGCHLCDEAKSAILAAGCSQYFVLQEINIETDADLYERYKHDIPVITINGVEAFRHRVDPQVFRETITRLALNQ
jgi:glutaredoxin